MDWKTLISEGWIALALICSIAAIVVIVLTSGAAAVGPTGLHDLLLLLGGALAGVMVQKARQ